ncbi:MAG TPA: hypothetical protein PLV03_00985 [Clostridiales bacterium]|nr:hypothetical protein [Clostridiales bacterium]
MAEDTVETNELTWEDAASEKTAEDSCVLTADEIADEVSETISDSTAEMAEEISSMWVWTD